MAACCVTGAVGASPALAAGSRSKVPAGVVATSIPNATVFGNTPSDTPETVSFVFRAHHLGDLEWRSQTGFGHDLSVSQFAATYGRSAYDLQGLENYLAGYGITASAYPNNLVVVANGTAGEFDSALAVTQMQYSTPSTRSAAGNRIPAQHFHGITTQPTLPSWIASKIIAVLGLTNYSPNVSNLVHTNRTLVKASSGSDEACLEASGVPDDCNLPSDFASDYGLNPLYKLGADGQGQTIGIVTFASVDPGAADYFWQNVAGLTQYPNVTIDNVDGGSGAPSYTAGSGETDIDVEQSGALAPGASIVVYEAPNTDYGQVDGLFTAATQDVAGSVSMSWGSSETYIQALIATGQESAGYQLANDEAMMELDAQGQAGFVAAGDEGAYYASADEQSTNLSTGDPDDSPYVTSAGGSTLPWSATLTSSDGSTSVSVSVPQQRIWGWDYLWAPIAQLDGISLLKSAEQQIGGGGGGFSTLERKPLYQFGVSGTSHYTAVPWLTPTDYTSTNGGPVLPTAWTINADPGTTSGYSGGRAQPDLAANADPYTGYVLYAPSNLTSGLGYPALMDGWGGTSFVAPQLNGSTAVIDSLLHRRVGFWNPSIYRFATSWSSPFKTLDTAGSSNDNLYYSGTPGQVYNAGAGLGIPNLSKLAFDFANQH